MTKLFLHESPSEGLFHLDREYKKRLTKVMRLKEGDELQVITPSHRWICRIAHVSQHEITLQVVKPLPAPLEPRLRITMGQAVPKGDRFEWLIQKATELGASEIFPIITERSVVRPANATSKIQRWNEIADQAAAQSENSFPPPIHPPELLKDFVARNESALKLLLHERAEADSLHSILQNEKPDHVAFVVGPEGGWTEQEATMLQSAGFRKVHLGNRILRVETAGLALLAILQYELGDIR